MRRLRPSQQALASSSVGSDKTPKWNFCGKASHGNRVLSLTGTCRTLTPARLWCPSQLPGNSARRGVPKLLLHHGGTMLPWSSSISSAGTRIPTISSVSSAPTSLRHGSAPADTQTVWLQGSMRQSPSSGTVAATGRTLTIKVPRRLFTTRLSHRRCSMQHQQRRLDEASSSGTARLLSR